jgi:precorrin-2 dehydrogenase / sirohydrochlorin ferrochelatase
VSVYPVMLDGSKMTALVVGGGSVAVRKVRALLTGGVKVLVVAPDVRPELRALATPGVRLSIIDATYHETHLDDALIVIAATDDAALNARVAADALRLGRLVNVVDAPALGNFVTPAAHRAGDLTVAVSTGRLPAAAGAVRDAIAARFDDRYARSIAELRELRDRLIAGGDRETWRTIVSEILGDGFCADVESGSITAKVGAWR